MRLIAFGQCRLQQNPQVCYDLRRATNTGTFTVIIGSGII